MINLQKYSWFWFCKLAPFFVSVWQRLCLYFNYKNDCVDFICAQSFKYNNPADALSFIYINIAFFYMDIDFVNFVFEWREGRGWGGKGGERKKDVCLHTESLPKCVCWLGLGSTGLSWSQKLGTKSRSPIPHVGGKNLITGAITTASQDTCTLARHYNWWPELVIEPMYSNVGHRCPKKWLNFLKICVGKLVIASKNIYYSVVLYNSSLHAFEYLLFHNQVCLSICIIGHHPVKTGGKLAIGHLASKCRTKIWIQASGSRT